MSAPRLPERWVRLYTVGLPVETREERRDEIASDVHEHCVNDRNPPERSVRVAVVGRTLRGVPGDVMWRFEEGRVMKQQQRAVSDRPTGMHAAWATVTQSWFTPIAALVGIFDVLVAVGVIFDPKGKMPGQAVGPVLLVGFAAAMFVGLRLRWRARYGEELASSVTGRRPNLRAAVLVSLAVVAVVAIAMGVIGSLVALLIGLVLLAGVVVATARRTARRAEPVPARSAPGRQSMVPADILIVVGTLPALAIFWLIIPAILAVVVIAGVIGTQPGARRHVAA